LRPENTVAAFDHGLAMGADGLELDVRLSRDGIVVVHHDPTLERTSSGRGRLADYTADELARTDVGFWFRPADAPAIGRGSALERPPDAFPFRGHSLGVPTLRSILQRYPDVPMIVELKVNDGELGRRTVDVLRETRSTDRVALGSFYRRPLRAARTYDPRIRTGAAALEIRWALYRSWVGWPLGHEQYCEFQVPERSGATPIISPRFIRHAHQAGFPVKVWTVNDAADMRRLLDWGADALITDRPDIAVPLAAMSAAG
jgi:glycerophosphoryl diester phosphodiesterase